MDRKLETSKQTNRKKRQKSYKNFPNLCKLSCYKSKKNSKLPQTKF